MKTTTDRLAASVRQAISFGPVDVLTALAVNSGPAFRKAPYSVHASGRGPDRNVAAGSANRRAARLRYLATKGNR